MARWSARARLARWVLRACGWRLVGTSPRRGLVVGAPHTSNWDFVLSVLIFASYDVAPRVLVKSEAFRWPIGPALRRLGALPTDRSGGGGLVARLAADASADDVLPAPAPDVTRRRADPRKSGLYRLAPAARPRVPGASAAGPSRTLGFGPTIAMTGDVAADMAQVRAFYADKHGVRPGRGSAVRLREEGD